MPDTAQTETRQAFRPRARLLQLLGDQLIGTPKLAVFELVKNAYDADASVVSVEINGLRTDNPKIIVQDDGQGMSPDTVKNVWLVPGDDHREQQRNAAVRSPKYGRLPLGEKGLGRFAVHKLGDRISMVTRAAGQKECIVQIDWSALIENRFLEDAEVTVVEREPEVFSGDATGTRIVIDRLRDSTWSRRDVRDLYRQVNSIASPFGQKEGEFAVRLNVPDHPEWISTLPDPHQLLRRAPWRFQFTFDGSHLSFDYEFLGVPGIRVSPREVCREETLAVRRRYEPDDLDPNGSPGKAKTVKLVATPDMLEGIGPISGQFFIFDRDRAVLSRYGESRFIERFLDQNGGVRVYRDGIRIYNYGEPGDDWLGLDLSRVNSPTRSVSRNIIVGQIELQLAQSRGLREKTNREGFVETVEYERLREIVGGILAVAATERSIDKQKIRLATGGGKPPGRDIGGPLADLRRIARRHDIEAELEPAIAKIEDDYNNLRDNFLRAGISQAGLAVVFHEVERGVAVLSRAIENNEDLGELKAQAGQLQGVLEVSTQLLRKSDREKHSLRLLIRRARDLNSVRFRVHNIKLTCPSLEEGAPDAEPVFPFGLLLGALTNIIDNAIYWLRVAMPEDTESEYGRRLYIGIEPDFRGAPAIIVADNGSGFIDDPSQVVEPFFSRRPDGMGLGLYYANMVMQLAEGQLAFPSTDEVDIPEEFDGAVVALVFKGGLG
jgi:anti-sigma regulatory factor (Ser/Thr protein kinase)